MFYSLLQVKCECIVFSISLRFGEEELDTSAFFSLAMKMSWIPMKPPSLVPPSELLLVICPRPFFLLLVLPLLQLVIGLFVLPRLLLVLCVTFIYVIVEVDYS